MNTATVVDKGILYRNPKPHVCGRHAAHPSVVDLGDGEMLASAEIGQAFESPDTRAHLIRSMDNGKTWGEPSMFNPELPGDRSDIARLSLAGDGTLIAAYFVHDRSLEGAGYTNPETVGFVRTELYIARSRDRGVKWDAPERVALPFSQPLECQSSIVMLRDGRWLLPTSLFRSWDGAMPDGLYALALVSRDQGASWSESLPIFEAMDEGSVFYETSVTETGDGSLVAVAWEYNERFGEDRPVRYALSADGRTFGPRLSTGLIGQTSACLALSEGRVLVVYRRLDMPGLYAAVARPDGGNFNVLSQTLIWNNDECELTHHSGNMSENFAHLKFGAPRIIPRAGGAYVVFWCYEDYQGIIRWAEIKI